MKLFFLFLIFVVLYIYFGYPLIIGSFSVFKKSRKEERKTNLPFVTFLILVHNEERVIREKIKNSLGLDYPKDKLELIIASDASDDKTDLIIKEYERKGIIFYREEERRGKNFMINNVIPKTTGELIVFSDANSFYRPDAIKNLVKNFQNPKVGCICGKLIYTDNTGSLVAKGESLYFKYEAMLKNLESKFGAVVTGNGAIYAIRRSLFSPLSAEVPNDFAHPIEAMAKGYSVLYEPSAVAEEKATSSIKEEFRRRVRIVLRSFTAFIFYQKKYNILKNLNSFFFISHKLLRWFIFPLLVIILFINSFLKGYFYELLFNLQIAFYLSALVGWFLQTLNIRIKIFYIPFYFCLINLAGMIGIYKFLIGKKEVIWEVAKTTR